MATETTSGRVGWVTSAYTAQYADPITLRAGELVTLDGRTDAWDGHAEWMWLWGTDPRGKSGWIPQGYIEPLGEGQGRTLRDYDARELTAEAGEQVTVLEAACGWLWCETSAGLAGWLPVANVREGDAERAEQ